MKNSLAFLELKRKVTLKVAILEYTTTTTFPACFFAKGTTEEQERRKEYWFSLEKKTY